MDHKPGLAIALAETIMARYPDPDTIPYRVWCYSRGISSCGFLKAVGATGDARYLAYARRFASSTSRPTA